MPPTDPAKLNFSAEEQALIFLKGPTPVVLTNAEGTILLANDTFYSFFEIDRKAKTPVQVSSLFIGEDSWTEIVQSCQLEDKWDGYSIVRKNVYEELVVKVSSTCIHEFKQAKACMALYFSETNEARQRIFKQGQLLRAAARCSSILVASHSFREGMDQVVEIIGKNVGADRCYIFENTWLPDSEDVNATLISQWNRKGLPDNTEDVQFVNYNILPGLLDTLSRNEPYKRLTRNFEGKTLSFLQKRQTKSMVCIPIQREGELWGFLGFDDCKVERAWDEQEMASLQLLANTLSGLLNRLQLRSQLEEKNEQLESAVQGAKDALWDYDIQKGKVYYSPQFLAQLGYEEGDLKGTASDLKTLLHPTDLKRIMKYLAVAFDRLRKVRDFELRLMRKDGHEVWVKVNASLKTDIAGNAIRMSGSNTDITLEKQIEESEKKYIELVENLRETVFELDNENSLSFLNRAWKLLTGHSESSSIGKKLLDFIEPTDRPNMKNMLQELRQFPNSHQYQLVSIRDVDGKIKRAEVYARSIEKGSNESYILGTIVDVTLRHQTEQKLKESEEKYRLISDNISDMVCLQSPDRTFIYVSPSIRQLLGYEPEELIGKTPAQTLDTPRNRKTLWTSQDWLSEGRYDYNLKRKDGELIWLETLKTIVGDPDSEDFIVQTTTRDITMHKQAEANLEIALAKEKELNEMKSNFISMASHEFRTPLTTIRSSIQLLQEYSKKVDAETRKKMERHHEKIQTQISRVTTLMNDVLTLGKLDAGKTSIDPVEGDLSAFIQELIQDHFMRMDDGRKLIAHLPDSLTFKFDPNVLSHVLINLITNAFKYSQGRKEPEIYLHEHPDEIEIKVVDYGIGIPNEDLSNIFQSFYRSKNAISLPGTGLGLVITKEFVHLHEGNIKVTSTIEQGTEVTVTLPKN